MVIINEKQSNYQTKQQNNKTKKQNNKRYKVQSINN